MATSKLSLPKLELITEDSDTRTMDGTADKKKPTKSFGEYKRIDVGSPISQSRYNS